MITSAQAFKRLAIVNYNSPFWDYPQLNDHIVRIYINQPKRHPSIVFFGF